VQVRSGATEPSATLRDRFASSRIELDMTLRIPRLAVFFWVLALAPGVGCAADDTGDDDGPGADDEASTDTGEPECTSLPDCEACLDIAGCNWTPEMCQPMCLQDAPCYGPGNPGAPVCPAGAST
jgi:hypothetical protein